METVFSTPAVGIVITGYRQAEMFADAICSALTQDIQCAVVLVNDGCPYSETHEICETFRSAYSDRVLYVRETNGGPSVARNAGIDVALRAWPNICALFVLDGDNQLRKSTIRRMLAEMIRTDADWVFPDLEIMGNGGIVGLAGDYSVLEHILRNYVDTGSLVARRLFDAGVRFDPDFRLGFIDWEFWLHSARRGFRGTYIPGAGFLYRRRRESLVNSALRNREEIIGNIRRKHSGWITPRMCTELEHRESPRYAVLVADTREVMLFTDPDDRSRRLELDEFLTRVRWHFATKRVSRMPAYFVVTSSAFMAEVDRLRVFHDLLWRLETACLRSRSGVTLVSSYELKGAHADMSGGCKSGAIALANFELAVKAPQPENTATLIVDTYGLPTVKYYSAVEDLNQIVKQIRPTAGCHTAASDVYVNNSEHRRKSPIGLAIGPLFGMSALFPLACTKRRMGFIIRDEKWAGVVMRVGAYASVASSKGWSTHLYWLQPAAVRVEKGDPAFKTISLLEDKQLESIVRCDAISQVLGAVGSMDVLINICCPEWLEICGSLRQYQCTTVVVVSDVHDVISKREVIQAALQVEYAVSVFLCDSKEVVCSLRALGVPPQKLITDFTEWLATISTKTS